MINDAIIEKIRKCLALGNHASASQGEAQAALARAREIAMKHDIDLASIELEDPKAAPAVTEVKQDESQNIRSKFIQPYHKYVFSLLRKCFGVHVIQCRRPEYNGTVMVRLTFIGTPTDIAVAKEIMPFLESVFPKIFNRAVREGRLSERRADLNGCYEGIYYGILQENRRQEDALTPQQGQTWAVVVRHKEDAIEQFLKEQFPHLKEIKNREKQTSRHARNLGYEAGRKIKLGQLPSPSSSTQIKG